MISSEDDIEFLDDSQIFRPGGNTDIDDFYGDNVSLSSQLGESIKSPKLLNSLLTIIVGSLFLTIAFYILIKGERGIDTALNILAVLLIISGFQRITFTLISIIKGGGRFWLYFFLGSLKIILGVLLLQWQDIGQYISEILALGLFIQGLSRILLSTTDDKISEEYGNFFFLIGFLTIIISIWVSLIPGSGTQNVALLFMGYLLASVTKFIFVLNDENSK